MCLIFRETSFLIQVDQQSLYRLAWTVIGTVPTGLVVESAGRILGTWYLIVQDRADSATVFKVSKTVRSQSI